MTALALAVATAATFLPALRAARRSTVASLKDTARIPRRRSAVIKLSAHLPASLLIGTRLAIRRPRRLILTLAGTAVTVSGLVAVLIMHAAEANPELIAPNDPLKARLSEVVVIISAVLVVFAAVNAIFIAWTTALETRHAASLARALGATTGQIIAGLSAAQILPALIAAALGIPCDTASTTPSHPTARPRPRRRYPGPPSSRSRRPSSLDCSQPSPPASAPVGPQRRHSTQ